MSLREKAVAKAIESVKNVQNSANEIAKGDKKRAEKLCSSFRTRAREFPEQIETIGLLPALTFMYAKAKRENYQKFFNQNWDELKNIGFEEFGYCAYLREVLTYIGKELLRNEDPEFYKEPEKAIEVIFEQRTNIIMPLLFHFLLELKKLSEAIFKGAE